MSKQRHDFRLAGSHRYGALGGSYTKPMYECSCGEQIYGEPIKGWWTFDELRTGASDHGRTGLFGRHKAHLRGDGPPELRRARRPSLPFAATLLMRAPAGRHLQGQPSRRPRRLDRQGG